MCSDKLMYSHDHDHDRGQIIYDHLTSVHVYFHPLSHYVLLLHHCCSNSFLISTPSPSHPQVSPPELKSELKHMKNA